MTVEVADVIEQLDETYPNGGDGLNESDDHHRLTKHVLKNQFPGSGGMGLSRPITCTEDEFDYLVGVTSSIQDQLDAIIANNTSKFDALYPVGALHLGSDPNGILTGTWTLLPNDTFLMASNVNGVAGGSNSKTLSESNLPSHRHNIVHSHDVRLKGELSNYSGAMQVGSDGGGIFIDVDLSGGSRSCQGPSFGPNNIDSQPTGSGQAFDVKPKYESVQVWKRTA